MLNNTVRRPKSTAQTPNRQHNNLNVLDVHYKSHCFPGTIPPTICGRSHARFLLHNASGDGRQGLRPIVLYISVLLRVLGNDLVITYTETKTAEDNKDGAE